MIGLPGEGRPRLGQVDGRCTDLFRDVTQALINMLVDTPASAHKACAGTSAVTCQPCYTLPALLPYSVNIAAVPQVEYF